VSAAAPNAPKGPKGTRRLPRFDPRRALGRLAVAIVIAITTTELLSLRFALPVQLLGGWDAGGLGMIALSWTMITSADATKTRARAGAYDPGRRTVYLLVTFTSFVTLFGATYVSRHLKDIAATGESSVLAGFSLAAVAIAWGLTHTSFTLRYAHLYYREDDEGVGGITFAGDEPPSYFDFAYFAFTVGMCFQVSDTTVTSCQIRRTVLAHALLSFAYSTVILAFVLNLVFGAVA
jgi:uncharacterized membrane protein